MATDEEIGAALVRLLEIATARELRRSDKLPEPLPEVMNPETIAADDALLDRIAAIVDEHETNLPLGRVRNSVVRRMDVPLVRLASALAEMVAARAQWGGGAEALEARGDRLEDRVRAIVAEEEGREGGSGLRLTDAQIAALVSGLGPERVRELRGPVEAALAAVAAVSGRSAATLAAARKALAEGETEIRYARGTGVSPAQVVDYVDRRVNRTTSTGGG